MPLQKGPQLNKQNIFSYAGASYALCHDLQSVILPIPPR